jgi:GDPmannose 4,6-dehydratase
MSKIALISGCTGQDGSYLAELLLGKGYAVHGLMRRVSVFTTERIEHLYREHSDAGSQFHLHSGDMLDPCSLRNVLDTVRPDEVYHLAAQSHVATSFKQPIYTTEVVALGTLHLLEAIRAYRDQTGRDVRFYNAGSSEMFGNADESPQNEDTPFKPRSPYAGAKVFAFHQVVNYREAYGLRACNGILFNHESPRRGETFVTRKITRAATRIKHGLQDKLRLGNIDAKRDWGFAGDYMDAVWRMTTADEPRDYVVATGKTHSVWEFVAEVFRHLGLPTKKHVLTNCDDYKRPLEVNCLLGNASKARQDLGWEPQVDFQNLVRMMCDADMNLAHGERLLVDSGVIQPGAGRLRIQAERYGVPVAP